MLCKIVSWVKTNIGILENEHGLKMNILQSVCMCFTINIYSPKSIYNTVVKMLSTMLGQI